MFITTAIYPNRQEDKQLIESLTGLSEQGNEDTCFYYDGENLIARGYERIVYGDHGPYIEFSKRHFKTLLVSKFGSTPTSLPPSDSSRYFYYWLYPINAPCIKVYWQIKPVTHLPNAPDRPDRKPSKFNRAEGYADYKRGYYYISPWDFINEKMIYTNTSLYSGKTHQMELPIDKETFDICYSSWKYKRMLIQDAFPMLTDDHREFILTGITPQEWAEMFPDTEKD